MNIEELEKSGRLILKSVAGSHLYGLNTPSSDHDVRGIYMDSFDDLFDITGRKNQEVSDDGQDIKFYSLYKFLGLALGCNPNIIELLWLPEDAIIEKSPLYDELVAHRDWFMSKKAMHTFKGYAYSQIQRAKGLNKKGNSISKYVNENGIRIARMLLSQPSNNQTRMEQAELNRMGFERLFGKDFVSYLKKEKVEWDIEDKDLAPYKEQFDKCLDGTFMVLANDDLRSMLPPSFSDFIYWYRNDENGFQFRPVPFTQDSRKYDASRVEGRGDMYRLYHNGNGFLDELEMNVRLTSISKERELDDYAGVVSVNIEEYKKARKDYNSFWEWMANRNEARYTNDWDTEGKVDWKNLMHTMRLLLCAKSIAETGVPKVRFEGEEREYLMNIRNGKYSYNEILGKADSLMNEMDGLFEKSSLPYSPNEKAVKKWYRELVKKEIIAEGSAAEKKEKTTMKDCIIRGILVIVFAVVVAVSIASSTFNRTECSVCGSDVSKNDCVAVRDENHNAFHVCKKCVETEFKGRMK